MNQRTREILERACRRADSSLAQIREAMDAETDRETLQRLAVVRDEFRRARDTAWNVMKELERGDQGRDGWRSDGDDL